MSRDPKQWRLELIVQKGSNGAGLPQILVGAPRVHGGEVSLGWRDRAWSLGREPARACESMQEQTRVSGLAIDVLHDMTIRA